MPATHHAKKSEGGQGIPGHLTNTDRAKNIYITFESDEARGGVRREAGQAGGGAAGRKLGWLF